MNFWERAVALGSRAQQYAEHLVATAIAQHDAALGARLLRIRSAMNQLVVHANALERDLNTAAAENYESMEFISESLEDILARLFEELKKMFPPPDQAPHHKKRLKHVDIALKKAEEAIIAFGMQHGISEEAMRVHMENIRPLLEQVVVEIGDLIEEHPILAETLLGIGVFMIIPASLILRPLLGVLGFGPYGPIEGSAAAWAQRVFIGAQIKVGTWFEHLQKAGLLEAIPKSIWETIKDLFQRFMQWAFHR
ncbi:uncharacterized protein LAESUDRAFT_725207 [Laetiporus sulphureus 93-53]|uniref:Uncharacterized protein n=1 Tax=Laetiporus sulphureus 93-53 TaxID=1314785 RepID=A0A165ELC2_9APHY|nr:uncharacterized protein LAESUDRAFT_725207 [Laetiporus sulphureus 93-53]KZT07298.1 hypothetical protein LAESUDRAFT_725207 [Laetiporus sulphureus 93-53]